jgi:hypothetical protein
MPPVSPDFLRERLELADELLARRAQMFQPQDLPGRYGRVIKAIDRVLESIQSEAVLGGGWAVWHHGFVGRITQDIDVALPANRVEEFLRAASADGFDPLPIRPGRWPKLLHKETNIQVDVLPEGARPGTRSRPAPTTIPHPSQMGGAGPALRYITLPSLIELKIAAGRARDESDVVEMVRTNEEQIGGIRKHLAGVHSDYAAAFDRLVLQAQEQRDQ